jgi:hypothetical protein
MPRGGKRPGAGRKRKGITKKQEEHLQWVMENNY